MTGDNSRALEPWGALLVRFREGDASAFEELVRVCERRVLAIAYQITGNLADAQDVAQESFLRVYRSRHSFQDGRSLEAWVYKIVVNQARKSLVRRKRRRMEPLAEDAPESLADPRAGSPSDDLLAENLSETLNALLAELSPRLRAVFVLRDLQGMETAEIAGILSCREGTVRRHSAAARTRIRELLRRRHPELLKNPKKS